MAKVVIILAVTLIAYIIGYEIGYHDCFNYLRQQLKNHIEEKNDGEV